MEIFESLHAAYGPQQWWPADSNEEVVIGAILTQNTAWTNVERAIENLKAAGLLRPRRLVEAPVEEVEAASAGYPAFYALNCSHPIEFEPALNPGRWRERLLGACRAAKDGAS